MIQDETVKEIIGEVVLCVAIVGVGAMTCLFCFL